LSEYHPPTIDQLISRGPRLEATPRAIPRREQPAHCGRGGRLASSLVVMVLVAGLLVGGCSSKKSSSVSSGTANGVNPATATKNIRAPKAKFVIHAGLAFGAFHRYLYKPFKAGTFKPHAQGRVRALVKGGLSGAFAYHELKLALTDAQGDPTLAKLVAPVTALQERIRSTGDAVKSGNANPQDLEGTNSAVEQLRSQSAQSGAPIKDEEPSSLSTAGT